VRLTTLATIGLLGVAGNPGHVASKNLPDSVTARPERSYPAGRLRRFFLGNLNRRLWELSVRLPVLNLAEAGGGLEPLRIIGGKQTVGLRMLGRDGLEYDFRPIVKHPAAVLPGWMRKGVVSDILDDQMAAQFPFGALIVAELEDAAGINAPRPVAVVMPDDARLGGFRSMFAGRLGLLAVNANERIGNQPGYGGYTEIANSDTVYHRILTDPESGFDDESFLRIRLIDMLVGDWDRHSDQWRWGRGQVGAETRWRPIPRDRDWAFARIDGVVGTIAQWVQPSYVGFSERPPPVKRLAISGDRIDHAVLNRLDRDGFARTARDLQARLTDSVIARAVATLPREYLPLERERLITALKARRDQLPRYSDEYYRLLAREIRITGILGRIDVVEFNRISDQRVLIRMKTGGTDGPTRYQRVIDGRETLGVKLFIDPGDQLIGADHLPFRLTISRDTSAIGGSP
jgi:hypothetical protein